MLTCEEPSSYETFRYKEKRIKILAMRMIAFLINSLSVQCDNGNGHIISCCFD